MSSKGNPPIPPYPSHGVRGWETQPLGRGQGTNSMDDPVLIFALGFLFGGGVLGTIAFCLARSRRK